MKTIDKLTKEQKKLVDYAGNKVRKQFVGYPDSAHDVDHVLRVVKWIKIIAHEEKSRSFFLCILSAWFHDIGRSIENNPGENTNSHAELSYKLLQKWFREDKNFSYLTKIEKIELLYCVRYHWNNEANKYDTAWILRDADKLDILGKQGLKRILTVYKNDDRGLNSFFRVLEDITANFKTKTAKKIIEDKKLAKPLIYYYKKYLRNKIEKIEQ